MQADGKLPQDEFIVLIARHERRVRGFVSTLVRQREDVDEIVQQTFLTAWQKLAEFQSVEENLDRDFMRWVCTIARFQALGFVRKYCNSRLLFEPELVEHLAEVQLREEPLLEKRREALSKCIEKLAASQKDLIRRYYRAAESAAEIAKQDGVTRQAIFKKLRAIRVVLHDCVGRSLRTSEA